MEYKTVGFKLPESGIPEAVEVGVAVGVAEMVDDGLAVGVGVGDDVGVAEGVDSKAGPSAA
jgi:hypothetical protein